MGGQVHPMRSSDSIMWTVKFRNGNMKRFKFPIRTTAEGAANAYQDLKGADLENEVLSTEKELKNPDPAKLAK
jgi:adenylylsulfate reductase subunit B